MTVKCQHSPWGHFEAQHSLRRHKSTFRGTKEVSQDVKNIFSKVPRHWDCQIKLKGKILLEDNIGIAKLN